MALYKHFAAFRDLVSDETDSPPPASGPQFGSNWMRDTVPGLSWLIWEVAGRAPSEYKALLNWHFGDFVELANLHVINAKLK